MQGNARVIELLNDVLTAELTAINQYFIHAKMMDNWGYERLAEHTRAESIDEMKHAERLIERILFLEGVPNMQRLFPVKVGETVPEQLRLDLDVEYTSIKRLNDGIAVAVEVGDNASRVLLETILVGEEDHADWLETQPEAMRQLGEQNYLAQQLHD
jgi:bacterioferritin